MAERRARLAYLGPEGTLTHEAIALLREHASYELLSCTSTDDVFDAVTDGRADHGIVPWESSAEGGLAATIDALIFDAADLRIAEEVVLPVRFGAWTSGAVDTTAVTTVVSHPFALAQCHRFISAGNLRTQGVSSTVEACRIVAETRDPTLAAIASAQAAARHGLAALADDVGDLAGDETRFVRVGRERSEPSGFDRTTLVLIPPDDRTGVLVRMLRPFSARDVDVASIVTRPLKSSLGQYCFVITCAGHRADPPLQGALEELLGGGVRVKDLGSYPGWLVERRPFDHLPPGTTEAAAPDTSDG